jgi:hypothetical protein
MRKDGQQIQVLVGLTFAIREHSPAGSECQIRSTLDWYPIPVSRVNPPLALQVHPDRLRPASIDTACRHTQASGFRLWRRGSVIFPDMVNQDAQAARQRARLNRVIAHRLARTAGDGCRARSPPNPDTACTAVVLPTHRSIRHMSIAGLRSGQTLATWIAPGAGDVIFLHSGLHTIRSTDRKAARVLLVFRLPEFVHTGRLLDLTNFGKTNFGNERAPALRHG